MSRLWIVVGDSTSHGGTVLNGDAILSADGKPVARIGDMVACPKCKGVFPIVSGAGNFIGSNGQLVARQGDSTACGATLVPGGQGHGVWESEAGGNGNIADKDSHIFDEQLRLYGLNGKPLANCRYILHLKNGTTHQGVTNSEGYTNRVVTSAAEEIFKLDIEYEIV